MQVGLCRVTLRMPENGSLKEKRRITKSLVERLRSRFNVAVAEVDDNDAWKIATLGAVCVSNEAGHANETISKVAAYMEAARGDWHVVDVHTEIIPGL
jgi:uncharacterized protein YlxP (DUF503 family)